MTTTLIAEDVRAMPSPDSRPRRGRAVAAQTIAALLLAGAVIGIRIGLHPAPHPARPAAAGRSAAPLPASPQSEAGWGIRFTNVIVLADNGGVELRYQVLDQGKAERIHLGDPMSNELPTIRVDGSRARITPSAVLMHFHHGDSVAGESYSIVYGNAGGVVHVGEHVTVVMKDGVRLEHMPVTD